MQGKVRKRSLECEARADVVDHIVLFPSAKRTAEPLPKASGLKNNCRKP